MTGHYSDIIPIIPKCIDTRTRTHHTHTRVVSELTFYLLEPTTQMSGYYLFRDRYIIIYIYIYTDACVEVNI